MEQTVYADLLFLINFSMDFLCMFLVARLLARRLSLLRGALASAAGGLYAVTSLFLSMGKVTELAVNLIFCFVMCLIAFAGKHERLPSLLLITAAYFLASMLLGGIMTAIFNLMNSTAPPFDSFTESRDMPLWLFAAVASVSTAITWFGGKFLRTRTQVQSAEVEIRLGKRRTVIRAMCDSGNLLRDSVSGKPVIVADLKNAVNLLPADCPAIADWTTDTVTDLPPQIASRVRIIPTATATADGLLFALRPDSVVIRCGNSTHTSDALVGFAEIRCTLRDCTAIVPPELIA